MQLIQCTNFTHNPKDLKALMLIFSVQRRKSTPTDLIQQLAHMNHVCRQLLREHTKVT